MTYSTTAYLGLQLAVVGTKQQFDTGVFNLNLQKLENKLQAVDGATGTAQGTANNAVSLANGAQSTANAALGNAAGAQNTANAAYDRTTDLYNRIVVPEGKTSRMAEAVQFISGVITPSAVNTNTSLHVGWSFSAKPVATVTPETGAAGNVRMTLTNISPTGCDVVINRSDNTSPTGFNIVVGR